MKKNFMYYIGLIIAAIPCVILWNSYGTKAMILGILIYAGCCIQDLGEDMTRSK